MPGVEWLSAAGTLKQVTPRKPGTPLMLSWLEDPQVALLTLRETGGRSKTFSPPPRGGSDGPPSLICSLAMDPQTDGSLNNIPSCNPTLAPPPQKAEIDTNSPPLLMLPGITFPNKQLLLKICVSASVWGKPAQNRGCCRETARITAPRYPERNPGTGPH